MWPAPNKDVAQNRRRGEHSATEGALWEQKVLEIRYSALDGLRRKLGLVDIVDHTPPDLVEGRFTLSWVDGQVLAASSPYEYLLSTIPGRRECQLRDGVERDASPLCAESKIDDI
jgi:hypothetical protein